MCSSTFKRMCKVQRLKLNSSEWRMGSYKKGTRLHWVVLFAVLCIWAVWMAQDINGIISGIEFTGSKVKTESAIEISGVEFVSEDIKFKHQALSTSMQYQCVTVSEDVLFAFQFSLNDRPIEDHIFLVCSNLKSFGNAKLIYRSPEKIKCTEEFNGELKHVIRSKEVTIKAIDIDEWKHIEYSTSNPKESCMIQHAIDVLELKWV